MVERHGTAISHNSQQKIYTVIIHTENYSILVRKKGCFCHQLVFFLKVTQSPSSMTNLLALDMKLLTGITTHIQIMTEEHGHLIARFFTDVVGLSHLIKTLFG